MWKAEHDPMVTEIVDFGAQPGTIHGLVIVTVKSITDDRGTIRELFRRSAFANAGIDLAPFQQINVTGTRRGAVRGMHAESMTKLVTVACGEVQGMYVDFRPDSPTHGQIESVGLRPGVQVLIPAGVGNGFQALTDDCQYVYCFDDEWTPTMPGAACSPLDPAFDWSIPLDPADRAQVSVKDAEAPSLNHVLTREAGR